jgi:hypothetical protein
MENEKGILRTLLILLEHQLDLETRLFDLELAYRAHRDSVLAHLPESVHENCRNRFDDLRHKATAAGLPGVFALHEAILEIRDLLKKKC